MSETTSEKPPENPASPAPADPAKDHTAWQKPPGYDPIDYEKLGLNPEQTEAVKARFNHLYAQAKAGTEAKTELREVRKHLDELHKAVDERFAPIEKAQTEGTKASYVAAIKQARDEGNVELEERLRSEMNKIDAPKVEAPKEVKPEQKNWAEDPKVTSWATEVRDGELVRPWVVQNHPLHARAMGQLTTITKEWEAQGIPMNDGTVSLLLKELDSRMTPTQTNGTKAPAVLSTSNVRPQVRAGDIDLDHEQKYTADRLYSHIKEPEKRYAAYAKSLKVLREQGMAR